MSEEHGWVGGKFYARLADVPCSALVAARAPRRRPVTRCGKPAANWRGWCDEHSAKGGPVDD